MKWITLIGDEHLSLSQIKNIKRIDAIHVYNADGIVNRYCIEYPDGHIFYDFDKDLSNWRDASIRPK